MKLITNPIDCLLGKHRAPKNQVPNLGARELEVMKIVWAGDVVSAQQVLEAITSDNLSLSTMQSTLERLHRKGLLLRQKSGRLYLYSAAISRSKLITQLLGDIAGQVSDGDMAPMVSGFMEYMEQEVPESISSEVREVIKRLPFNKNV